MKTVIAIVMALVLTVAGCQSGDSRGGSGSKDDGFKIGVPIFETNVKQGELRTVAVSIHRGDYFKQDVKLEIKTTPGIDVEPTSIVVKASDKPDVQLRITAGKEAALSEYRVYVKGTPAIGEPTSADFNVKVVAP